MKKLLIRYLFKLHPTLIALFLLPLLFGCGSGCYQQDVTQIQQGGPSYNTTNSVQVNANGNYNTNAATSCDDDPNQGDYGQWVNSNASYTTGAGGISTSVNIVVSGVVSMCNGRANTSYNTLSNMVSNSCFLCSQFFQSVENPPNSQSIMPPFVMPSSSSVPSCCSSCGYNGEYIGSCLNYCSANNGATCPYSNVATDTLPPQCDSNCTYGSMYFIPSNVSENINLTYNVLPNDKVTFFVDAPNQCGSFTWAQDGTSCGGQPCDASVNRWTTWDLRVLPYPANLQCTQSICSSPTTCPSVPYTEAICPVSSTNQFTQNNLDGTFCWITGGGGLQISADSNSFYLVDTNVPVPPGSQVYDPVTGSPYGLQFVPLAGSLNNQSGVDEYSCRQVIRSFVNTTGGTIDTISAIEIDAPGQYYNNLGGYTVYVTHESCRSSNGVGYNIGGNNVGELLLWVLPAGVDPNQSGFDPASSCNGGPCPDKINLSSGGYQKISCNDNSIQPPWSGCPCANGNCGSLNNSTNGPQSLFVIPQGVLTEQGTMWFSVSPYQGNWTNNQGSLQVNITMGTTPQSISNIIGKIVADFTGPVYGSLQNQFSNITCPSASMVNGVCEGSYFNYIRTLLVLYITGYGLLFVMGMVNISQVNLVIKLVKIGVILALTMPDSWTFFYDNFFKLFLNGSAVLISESVNGAFQSQYANCPTLPNDPNNPYLNNVPNPFCFLDFGFNLLFINKATWMKFASLMVLTPITFIMFWFMVYGLVMYIMAIFKAVVSYMLSIAAIAILLLLAPIFIPFILFEQTQSLFSNWLKFLIQYTIGPVLLLIGLNVITMLLYLTVQQVLDFTVCWGCRWNVTIPLGLANLGSTSATAFCLQWFVPYGYSPGGAGASTQAMGLQFIYFVFFILILDLMKNYGSYVQNITSSLSNLQLQKFRTRGEIGGGGGGGIPGQMLNSLKRFGSKVVGQDEGSVARRRGFIESRRGKRKTDATVTMDGTGASPRRAGSEEAEYGDLTTGNLPAGDGSERGVTRVPPRLQGPAAPATDDDIGAPPPSSSHRRR